MRLRVISFFSLLLLLISTTAPILAVDPIQWRVDYNAARKEATEKNLPLFIEIQSEQCIYCRKMEASTLRDPGIVATINGQFIPLKIDGNKDRELALALRVQLYPTLVLASPDGRIDGFFSGFQTAEQIREPIKRIIASTSAAKNDRETLQGAAQFELVNKAISAGEYAKAAGILNLIVSENKSAVAVEKAKKTISEIESLATIKLTEAKNREILGDLNGALATLQEVNRQFAGLQSAELAKARIETVQQALAAAKGPTAETILVSLKEHARKSQITDAVEQYEKIKSLHASSAEAIEATKLMEELIGEPNKIIAEIENQNEQIANQYLKLAESWKLKGNMREANACFEQVIRILPGSRIAALAQAKLSLGNQNGNATTTGLKK